ncbi:MAG TPA: GH3 auxin-responsive promoter family protein [Chitinophagales bacterium]|nr:GH3 auxin-responsive promoter family protein [Chitinophagales bacterium]
MGYKATIAKLAANIIAPSVYKEQKNAVAIQQQQLTNLVKIAAGTQFGQAHHFADINNYNDFRQAVKLYDYEDIKDYIALIADGKPDVLWPGRPLYFCKSSGTTSGVKYIPVTDLQMKEMIRAARNSLMMYVAETGNAAFFDHKMIFLQGSPELDMHGMIPAGRLSGIVYHHVPFYVNRNRMPSYATNCIEDWEEKVDAIARETLRERMSLISGIPPWVVMYFERLKQLSGKQFIKDIFPDFKVFAYGGVNYEPYRRQMEYLIGFKIDSVETYPASEGFIAYQDSQHQPGLLLNVTGGIFYEFVKAEYAHKPDAKRISLAEVEVGVNYALILNTTAGLFGYSIGDTVKFVSTNPYRILVTGRVKHFISAFGEHVIGEEVEQALLAAMRETGAGVSEFTVAPQVNPTIGLPYHEWFVEFSNAPNNLARFSEVADRVLQDKNVYYKDLRTGNILQQLQVRALKPNAFASYMKTQGKLGGQNKVPRLMNDRKIADELSVYILY